LDLIVYKSHINQLLTVKILYLSEENLKDRLFIKDLVHNFKFDKEVLLLHAAFNHSISDTRFVTKRISAFLSEEMIYNNAFSADQRDFFYYQDDKLYANIALMQQLFQTVQLLILSPIVKEEGTPQLIDPLDMIHVLRGMEEVEELFLFAANPLSPLVAKRPLIESRADVNHWMTLFEEESDTLERAYKLRPARVVSPTNYSS